MPFYVVVLEDISRLQIHSPMTMSIVTMLWVFWAGTVAANVVSSECSITYKDGEPSAELRPCCQAYYDEFRADHTEWAYFNNHDVSALGEGDLINPHYFGARYRNFWRGALVTITFLEVSQILALHQFTVNAAE